MRIAAAAFTLLALLATSAPAEIFEITYETTFEDFSGPVFGESGPTVLFATSFLVDTEAAPVVTMPAGTGDWPVDLFGYDISAVSGLSVTFGTNTWDASHASLQTPEGGFDGHLWFDAPLQTGATPETWLTLSDEGGSVIEFGGGACSPCELRDEAVVDDGTGNSASGIPLDVFVRLVACGDGILDAGEACDDGNTQNGDGCTESCTVEPPRCGDGAVDPGEECDDGNTLEEDGCSNACTIDFGGTCPPAPSVGCVAATRGSLKLSEKKAGSEKLSASLKKFDAPTGQADFGDPATGATQWATCVYDGAGALALQLHVDRAGASCGAKQKPCWKAKGTKGFAYKDPDAAADGVRKISASSGPIGKGKLSIQAGNKSKNGQTAFPAGTAATLAGATSATLQLRTSDALCYEVLLNSVKKSDSAQFQAKTE